MAKHRQAKAQAKAKPKKKSTAKHAPKRRIRVPQKDKPPELWPWAYVETTFWTQCLWRTSKVWVYIKRALPALARDEFEVGYFNPDGLWHDVKRFATEREAQELVHYLNGGNRA